jgi:hypothetical protein
VARAHTRRSRPHLLSLLPRQLMLLGRAMQPMQRLLLCTVAWPMLLGTRCRRPAGPAMPACRCIAG